MNFIDSVERSDSKIKPLDYQKCVDEYKNNLIEVKMGKGKGKFHQELMYIFEQADLVTFWEDL